MTGLPCGTEYDTFGMYISVASPWKYEEQRRGRESIYCDGERGKRVIRTSQDLPAFSISSTL